ncbi:hypothetical protein [Croceicoccus mobilis]|uniref:Uncharacterized protein n=1 Tax=Croceicoccus mobilis TaxID=1703339 RepID=A0A916YZ29_9SPHN|nr:hypothetical protein [Croceicoccus mobilis]GGD67977.1 hypothetical protein GCM10010990_16850 [Croceicoccus mobilis]
MSVSVILHEITGASDAEQEFIRKAVGMLRTAVQTPGFGSSVRQAEYSSASWQGKHGGLRELDGDAIWERIAQGRECGQCADHTLDLAIEVADLPGPDSGNALIGSTRLGTLPIRSARWFLQRCMDRGDLVNYAAHIMHQWMHVSGFVHRRDGEGKDAPSVVARLVRRTLEVEHGDHIQADITALLTLNEDGCDCCREDASVTLGEASRAA